MINRDAFFREHGEIMRDFFDFFHNKEIPLTKGIAAMCFIVEESFLNRNISPLEFRESLKEIFSRYDERWVEKNKKEVNEKKKTQLK